MVTLSLSLEHCLGLPRVGLVAHGADKLAAFWGKGGPASLRVRAHWARWGPGSCLGAKLPTGLFRALGNRGGG